MVRFHKLYSPVHFTTSVVTATHLNLNQRSTSTSGGWIVGPTNKQSFREVPDADLADASKTARTLVVVLDALYTTCEGR